MQQLLREGVGFVEPERAQLSMALALSYEGGPQMSAIDRSRLTVLDAIAEATAGVAVGEETDSDPLHVEDVVAAQLDLPPPIALFEPLSPPVRDFAVLLT
jgi:hypothetical protein